MKATALFMTAGALAAVSAGAYDGYGYDPRPASAYNDTISGAARIGYDSRYAYKDLVASSLLNRSGVFTFGGEVDLNLVKDWKQEIGAEYLAFCDGLLSDKNAFNADWKAVKELFPNLTFRGGYEFNSGGLPGYLSKYTGKAPTPWPNPLPPGWRTTIRGTAISALWMSSTVFTA